MDSYKTNCALVASVIASHGVRHVVCSPGSRNAPMLLAADECRDLTTHVIIDERAAAFFALGLAQETQQPVAIICTSGTAVLDYAPAVAEAYYQGLPLIVISADRPQRWIDQDDSQTLHQPGVLANFVKKSYDLPDVAASDSNMSSYIAREANDAMITALADMKGPVHINLRIDEPLTPQRVKIAVPKLIECLHADDILSKETVRELARKAAQKRVLVITGFMQPNARLNKAMLRLAALPNVYVMHETLSNLHLPDSRNAVDVVLSTLDEEMRSHLAPDIVVTLGGALVSRIIKEYIRSLKGIEHWAVGHTRTTVDCFNALTLRIDVDAGRFISMLGKFMGQSKPQSGYAEEWAKVKKRALHSHDVFLRTAPWSDLVACQTLFDALPKECNLQLSNGTSVRYAQICIRRMPHACHCNRGVSGIDGSLSTAVGAALTYPEMTLLLTGDMSMAYDVGALALPEITDRLKIVVLNNQGGGIFRFINSTRSLPERERYFCAEPKLPLGKLAGAYGFEYFSASNRTQLEKLLPIFLSPRLAPAILEIVTPGLSGGNVLRDYMNRPAPEANYLPPANGCLFPIDAELF